MSEEGAARADRAQRAREAYYGRTDLPERHEPAALDEALDVATRVRLSGKVFEAGFEAYDKAGDPHSVAIREALAAAFRAAGFEVEE